VRNSSSAPGLLGLATLLAAANLAPASWAAGYAPVDAVLACRGLTEPVARLACFDRTTGALAAPLGASASAPSAATAIVPPAAAAPGPVPPAQPFDARQEFGMHPRDVAAAEVAAGIRAPDVKNIQAAIVAIGFAANGRMLFTLDNGQVWRQLVREGELLAKVGDSVTISRGLFGSFWLQAASGRGCKVNRVD
jgi:hypothetical protein